MFVLYECGLYVSFVRVPPVYSILYASPTGAVRVNSINRCVCFCVRPLPKWHRNRKPRNKIFVVCTLYISYRNERFCLAHYGVHSSGRNRFTGISDMILIYESNDIYMWRYIHALDRGGSFFFRRRTNISYLLLSLYHTHDTRWFRAYLDCFSPTNQYVTYGKSTWGVSSVA